MANLGTNPWSFNSADVASATPVASPNGLILNADGTVTITTGGALTFNTSGVPPANWFTVISATNAAYNGEYLRLVGASGGTVFTMQPLFNIPAGTAASGGGTVAQCLWPWNVRIEDLSWQGLSGLGASGSLDLRDRTGNPLWQAAFINNTGSDGYQNRGKLFWVEGITPITIAANTTVIATIN